MPLPPSLRPCPGVRRLLAAIAVLTTPALANADAVVDPGRLDHAIVPTREEVRLVLDADRSDYTGSVNVALEAVKPSDVIRFHARALKVDAATLVGSAGAVPVTSIEPVGDDQVRLHLASALKPGAYKLQLTFHNAYNTRAIALYKVVTGGHGYLFTQFEANEAREAFPCWDEPEFKIPWQLTLTVPKAHMAVSNTPIVSETPGANGTKVVAFKETRPLPSYLIAIATGPLESVPIPGLSVPGRVVTVQGQTALAAEAAKVTPSILNALQGYFGRPYPYEKLDLIAAPEFLYGAMENAGAVIFADRRLLVLPGATSAEQERQLTGVIAHELAHMWFGDLVTMKWWDDLWLNESFASWMATHVMNKVYPEVHSDLLGVEGTNRAFTVDSRLSTRAMRQTVKSADNLNLLADELAYQKGEAVLTMFEGWLGVETFRQGVVAYLKAHEWRNAEGQDLWNSISKASGQDISAAMSTFLDQGGVPLVTVEPLDGGRVKLSQKRFLFSNTAPQPTRWRIPVILKYATGTTVATKRVWLADESQTVDLGTGRAPDWIYPNAGNSGYYRWIVPGPMLTTLSERARARLDPIERMGFVHDVSALLEAGLVHGDDFLRLTAPFADDPAPEVVAATVRVVNGARAPLVVDDDADAFAAWLRATFGPPLQHMGIERRSGEPLACSFTRPLLLRFLADAGQDTHVRAYAESLGVAYRKDPRSIDPSLIECAITIPALRGDRALFDEYQKRFESTRVPIERQLYLTGLGTFRDPALQKAALDYALSGPLRPQEVLMVPGAMSRSSTGGEGGRGGGGDYPDFVQDWVRTRYADITAHLPANFLTRVMILWSGCDDSKLSAAEAFYAEHKVDGGDRTINRMADAMHDCAHLHAREADHVSQFLKTSASRP